MVLKTKNLQDQVIAKERGLRPYVQLEDVTYRQALDRTTWAEMQNLAPEAMSEFEKPYRMGDNYPRMQYEYPFSITYRWPGIRWPRFPEDTPGAWDFPTDRRSGGGCTIECDSPFRCGDPVECFVSDNAVDFSASYTGGQYAGSKIDKSRGSFGQHSKLPGSSLLIQPPAGENFSSFGDDDGQDKLKICISTDTETCCDDLNMFCFEDPCAEAAPLAADTGSNPDTMTQSDSIGIGVTGGLGPYNWESLDTYNDDETQYTFGAAQTAGGTNTLNSSGSSCGSATVKVTDACGNEVYIYVRNTSSGQWLNDHTTNMNLSFNCDQTPPPPLGSAFPGGSCQSAPDTVFEGSEALRLHLCYLQEYCIYRCNVTDSGNIDCSCGCGLVTQCTGYHVSSVYTSYCQWQKWAC